VVGQQLYLIGKVLKSDEKKEHSRTCTVALETFIATKSIFIVLRNKTPETYCNIIT